MKTKMLTLVFCISTLICFSQSKQENNNSQSNVTFKVSGNCGMCKSRIEKALAVDGIEKATWDGSIKMIEISYISSVISEAEMHQLIANAGHDTEKAKAKEDVYNKLPGCCKYDREKEQGSKSKKKNKKHSGSCH